MSQEINIFKHIVFELKEWYKEYHKINDEQFNSDNDFSILKLIKLQFFVTAINSEETSLVLDKYQFFAMPYGPVESQTYAAIKENKNLENFNLDNFKTIYNIGSKLPTISEDLQMEIMNSITTMKANEPNLINADAGTLVDLSHKWSCWKKNYALARAKKTYSSRIPDEEIKKDIKILNLDLV